MQVTAVGLLKESAVPKGEWLMLTAAGSSIGRQIIQIGHSYGMKIIAIVRQYADQQELLRLGCVVKSHIYLTTSLQHIIVEPLLTHCRLALLRKITEV